MSLATILYNPTMTQPYRPNQVRAYYDAYGDREWTRFNESVADRVSLTLHQRFQAKWIRRSSLVLETGAGPGRFTIALAELGATVVVTDISSVQLRANQAHVTEAGHADSVEAWRLADVTDLSDFEEGSFSAVSALGGPLSYVFDGADQAANELIRVVEPGGLILVSVMSRWGAIHQFLDDIVAAARRGLDASIGTAAIDGDLLGEMQKVPGLALPHECHAFTWEELQALFANKSCRVVDASASNFLSLRADPLLADLSFAEWERLLELEEMACRSSGVIGAGTHILLALEKTGA